MLLSNYYHTVRNLKARQIIAQISNRIRPYITNHSAFFHKHPPVYTGCRWTPDTDILPPGGQGARQIHATTGEFTFLNRTEKIGWPPRWDCRELPRLWQYNLHYFDWLWSQDNKDAFSAVDNWIAQHPLKRNQTGWEPYPTSLRIMNWTAFFFGTHKEKTEVDVKFLNRIWRSLYLQAEWLQRNLEYHLMANHLLENAAALTLIGSCFNGPSADQWEKAGLTLLKKELAEQILPDGMHFERSPMYHTRALYVLLLLAGTKDRDLIELLHEPIVKLSSILPMLCHPDGGIALLQDSALNTYNSPQELMDYASKLFPELDNRQFTVNGPFALPDAGYFGWRGSEGHYIICDTGAPSPNYQPGHSHAGILSFELSLFGRRIIVDSGVYTYEHSDEREYCRSTRAHNTVEVGGMDQCSMWGSFRIGQRANVKLPEWSASESGFSLNAIHDGYSRFHPNLLHNRRFIWDARGCLQVTDIIEGSSTNSVISYLHLHPDCRIDLIRGNFVYISFDSVKICIECKGKGKIYIQNSSYCPDFGQAIIIKRIEFRVTSNIKKFGFSIILSPNQNIDNYRIDYNT